MKRILFFSLVGLTLVGCVRQQAEDTPFKMIEQVDFWSSRKLVGIAIQHSDSEQEELFVHDSM